MKFWNTSPKLFLMLCNFFLSTYCAAPDSLIVALSPQYDNVPSSIFSRRVAHLKNVDLPEPDGPIIATTSPSLTSIDISFNTSRLPNVFFTCFISSKLVLLILPPSV